MIYDHEKQFEVLANNTIEGISEHFPVIGAQHTLLADNIRLVDKKVEDYQDQMKARLGKKDWTVPIKADLKLLDSNTGRIIDRKEGAVLANLPKTTSRHSYIVGGNEYQVANVWRRRPGVFAHIKENGEMESDFHIKGKAFKINFDPETKLFNMKYGGSNPPLYPVMRSLGVSDNELKKMWGKEIYDVNASQDVRAGLNRIHKALTGTKAENEEQAVGSVVEAFSKMELDPEIAKMTLGKPYTKVGGNTLVDATSKLLRLSRGEIEQDPRDALMFKGLHSIEDDVRDSLIRNKVKLVKKITNNLERRNKINEILSPSLFSDQIKSKFIKDASSSTSRQINPLDMLSDASKTTIMGPGAITSDKQVTSAARAVDPSHMSFLDPMHTPEGEKVGVISHLAVRTTKDGITTRSRVYNIKKGKLEDVDAATLYRSVVVMPDQVNRSPDDKVTPKSAVVSAAGPGNELMKISYNNADYAMLGPENLFGVATNMVPFLQNVDGARTNMAVRHMTQAIGLKDPDVPLVMSELRDLGGGVQVPWDKIPAWVVNTYAKENGTVTKVTKDNIYVKGKNGKTSKYPVYNDFPLNTDGAFVNSRSLVSIGDKVRKGQTVADTNFTKGDNLAIGKNLRVAFMPIPGRTFEDAVVISDSASKKLASEHLYKKEVGRDPETITEKNKYIAQFPTKFTNTQLNKLDESGIAQVGQVIEPGDPILLAIRKKPVSDETRQLRRIHKSLVRPFNDNATSSDFSVPAKVIRVHQDPKHTTVFLRTLENAQAGDKISGRHGNKGVIGDVFPDNEMPVDKDGKPIEVVINPYGIPSRMNPGQIYELAIAKIAEKEGRPRIVKNFGHDDYNKYVEDELKKAGISEKESLHDAKSGQLLGDVTVGPMYLIKQKHQVEKKMAVRGGGFQAPYDNRGVPKRGGKEGAQALAQLDQYAVLAHGAKGFLREAHTIRSDREQAMELWNAIQSGQPLPTPQVPFTQKSFEAQLQGLGVNLDKKGNSFRIVPASDKDIKALSNGKIKNATILRAKDLKEEKGGLMDLDITGGREGDKWAHYELPEMLPNPVMEDALTSVAGITNNQMKDVIAGKRGVTDEGVLTDPDKGTIGGAGISNLLKAVNVNAEIKILKEKIPRLSVQLRDKARRRLRYLQTLKNNKLSPTEAYMMKNVPIIPPMFRPIAVLPSGDLRPEDLNELYKATIISGQTLQKAKGRLPDKELNPIRVSLYEDLSNVMGIGEPKKRIQGDEFRGILYNLHGKQLKTGFVQGNMMKRRLDLSGRAIITPVVVLDMDEVGLPEKVAKGLYKPFVVRRLTSMGYTPLSAQENVEQNTMIAKSSLKNEMEERPVFVKRDPVLHKYGVMALKPRVVSGNSVRIHPLITEPYNADFDGDSMSVFTPISKEAVKDAWNMLPSKHLFSPSTGKIAFAPTNEQLLGLYKMSNMGKKTTKKYALPEDALKAMNRGEIRTTDVVKVGTKMTTPGRLMLYKMLPSDLRTDKVLTDPSFKMDKNLTKTVLQHVGKTSPGKYASVAQKMVNVGNIEVYRNAHTLGISDFRADKATRAKGLSVFNRAMKALGKKDQESMNKIMTAAEALMRKEHSKKQEASPSNLFMMHKAGVKPKWAQYKQMILAPGLVEDRPGHIVPYPVTKSYGEGLDASGYWIKSFGGRKGMVDKGLEVREPGALTKRMVNTAIDTLITTDDCGTKSGEPLSVFHPDVVDRYSAEAVPALGLKRNQIITPSHVSKAKANSITVVKVRSPHRCSEGQGICKKCFGLAETGKDYPTGTNIGILASQAVGERGTQLTMRTFHTGGIAQTGMTSAMNRVSDLLRLPKTMKDSATLSTENGKITDIKKDPAGGSNVFINGMRHYVPAKLGTVPGIRKGATVQKGQPISTGVLNPHKLLPIVGIDSTRRAIADELDSIYSGEGIRRRNIEVITRALTNLAEVTDPGEDTSSVVGDVVRLSKVLADNKKLKRPIKVKPILKGMEQIPHDQTEDWIARLNHTNIRSTIRDAVANGYVSNLHSQNPVPALMHGAEFGLGDGINY